MKILYIVTQSSWGGAQKYVFELVLALKNEHQVEVACGGQGELMENLQKQSIKTYNLKYLKRDISFFSEIKSYFELNRLLKKTKPDILHVNSSKAGVLGSLAARKLPIKIIYTVHGAVFTAAFSRLFQKVFKLIEKVTAKYKHKIIAVSENDRRLWLKNKICQADKIKTINNGIDLDKEKIFLNRSDARNFFNENARGFKNQKIIGTIANFYAEKNLLFLLKTFNHFFSENKNIFLIIIGNGPEKNKLKKFIRENNLRDNVFLPGYLENASKYLKAFDIFVLPSKKEGFPYVLLEAQLAKVPIIASRKGGIPEIVIDGVNGLLFESENQKEFTEKIKKLLDDENLSNNLTRKAYLRVKEKFSKDDFILKTKNIYGEVVLSAED